MRRTKLQTYVLVLLLVTISALAYHNTKALRTGPQIKVITPTPYQSVASVVTVEGTITKPKEATINEKPLLVTKDGYFITQVILYPGVDTIDIWAVNAYGKESFLSIPVYARD